MHFRLALSLLFALAMAHAQQTIVGTWEGSYALATGFTPEGPTFDVTQFRMLFTRSGNGFRGTYTDSDKRRIKIKVLEVSPDGTFYMVNVGDDCWNVTIDKPDEFSGVWNGSKCTKYGIGGGVRLIPVSAKRIGAP